MYGQTKSSAEIQYAYIHWEVLSNSFEENINNSVSFILALAMALRVAIASNRLACSPLNLKE